jgi:hypothetical protein
MSDTYQRVLEKLHALVVSSRTDGGVISTGYISKVLLAEFPDCGISIGELETLVVKEAARGGIAVAIDGHPQAGSGDRGI